jgi:hypothetical protein
MKAKSPKEDWAKASLVAGGFQALVVDFNHLRLGLRIFLRRILNSHL